MGYRRWGGAVALLAMLAVYGMSQERAGDSVTIQGKAIPVYPALLKARPDGPSPFTTEDGREFVTVLTSGNRYWLIPVTVEDGAPWIHDRQWGKGRQLEVDRDDFPTLARTGLHSEIELEGTRAITGRSVAEITISARPGCLSGEGFIAAEEDILSVLLGDNRLVRRLGLTHPDLARALFHFFNIIRAYEWEKSDPDRPSDSPHTLFYNDRRIRILGWRSGKGWQSSIFDDEILGYYHLELGRDPSPSEAAWLKERYAHLDEEAMKGMLDRLTRCHTGEMAAFYIMRYGFYEGHTGYRADPLALAFIFGLKTLEEIDRAAEGRLDEALIRPCESIFSGRGGSR
jgi:hypothetical protein